MNRAIRRACGREGHKKRTQVDGFEVCVSCRSVLDPSCDKWLPLPMPGGSVRDA